MDSRDPIGRVPLLGPTDNAYRPPLFGPMETPLLEQRFRLVNWADCYSDSVGINPKKMKPKTKKELQDELTFMESLIEPHGPFKAYTRRERIKMRRLRKEIDLMPDIAPVPTSE